MPLMNLCTLDEVKGWLNIPLANVNEDARLNLLIPNVSALIRQYCSRVFDSQSVTERYNGSGTSKQYLKNAPVTAVASFSVDGQTISAAPDSQTFGFLFDSNLVYIVPSGLITRGVQNVSVTYTAGYVRNLIPASDELPQDLRQAAIELTALKYRRRLHVERTTETLAGQTTTYETAEMTKEIKGVLGRYRRVVPV